MKKQMMQRKHKLQLNCIEMKRKIQEQIAIETRGMTPTERLRFFQQKAAQSPFAQLLNAASIPSKPEISA